MITVFRIRCPECKKNYTLVTKTRKLFKEGEGIGLTCKKLKEKYPSSKGCKQDLIFFRYQGQRPEKSDDIFLEDLMIQESEKKG